MPIYSLLQIPPGEATLKILDKLKFIHLILLSPVNSIIVPIADTIPNLHSCSAPHESRKWGLTLPAILVSNYSEKELNVLADGKIEMIIFRRDFLVLMIK